ncbi:MAG: phosphodiester glycosidase family protein [Chloroflexi bacterium]|nr:phosphodiester glycosidase family protein [Chloroflexota bacterium]
MLRFLCLLLVSGCTLLATPTPTPTPLPTPTPAADGWETLAPGLERRVYLPDEANLLSQIIILRVNPAQYTFRAHYRPGNPLTLLQWRAELPEATIFINANFFTPEFEILGLLVSDGAVYGQSYAGYGGTFAVENGLPGVWSNATRPYQGEALEQAVQGFPMLVADSQPAYHNPDPDRATRRTFVGQDSQGRIILGVTPLLGLTLVELSAFLPTTDLGLVNAVNLDGGGSTMLSLLAPGVPEYRLISLDPVPAVLAVYAR